MTVNDFNSKVNLPGLCLALGHKGFSFKKVPKFGWFAFNEDRSFICNLFQLLPEDMTPVKVYRKLTLEKSQYLEVQVNYSEIAENKLKNNWINLQGWTSLLSNAVLEAQDGKIVTKKGKIKLATLMEEMGYPKMLLNKIGLLTKTLINSDTFRWLALPASAENKLLVPTWCTPFHPCSFEVVDPTDLSHTGHLFTNREKGWYGTLGKCVVSGLSELGYREGFVWEKKADIWADKNQIVELSEQLNEDQCIRIWTEAQNTTFDRSPIDVVVANKKEANLQHYVRNLTLKQIKELEDKTLVSLRPAWQAQQEEEVLIGGMRFIRRNCRYYLERQPGSEVEFTNFTVTMRKIIKKADGKFYQTGTIYYNDTETDFEFTDFDFQTSYRLGAAIRKFFMEAGIGLPIILSTYKQFLINVIQKFNENVEFECTELEAKKKGSTEDVTLKAEAPPSTISEGGAPV